ncbi:MAG: dTDP-4-dehydrorhamnose 3,5-epimerase [Bacteroidia bacterium]
MFNVIPTSIPDLIIIEPKLFKDSRGFFVELFNRQKFDDLGLGHLNFVQDNLSSSQKGILRGLHFQFPPYAQGKLVTALQGIVLDVAVDLRKNSPTYGKHETFLLEADKLRFLYVPEGFAHGFQVVSDTCLFYYKCTNLYHAESDAGLKWDDPDLGIKWEEIPPILSAKDEKQPAFAGFQSPF